ncbi:MAG TPA: hypothetical protein VLH38_04315 [Patescibacteria group bacterium]|nr:hypothetical protein [Patescibacteria group bacterium]
MSEISVLRVRPGYRTGLILAGGAIFCSSYGVVQELAAHDNATFENRDACEISANLESSPLPRIPSSQTIGEVATASISTVAAPSSPVAMPINCAGILFGPSPAIPLLHAGGPMPRNI